MGKAQGMYDARIRPMIPSERLQLARLILDGLTPAESGIDVSDEWGESDLAEAAAYSVQHAGKVTTDTGAGNESR